MADNMPLVARIMVQHGGSGPPSGPGMGGGLGGGDDAPEDSSGEKSFRKKLLKKTDEAIKGGRSHIAKTLGIQVGIASILKQSQVFTGYIGTIFQLMGALVDVILAPFLPILIPAIKLLASFIPVARDLMKSFVAWIIKVYEGTKEWLDGLGIRIGKLPPKIVGGIKKVLAAVLIGVFLAKLLGVWKLVGRIFQSTPRLTLRVAEQSYTALRTLVTSWAGMKPALKAMGVMSAKATTMGSIYTYDVRALLAGKANSMSTVAAVNAGTLAGGAGLSKIATGQRFMSKMLGNRFGKMAFMMAAMLLLFEGISWLMNLFTRGNRDNLDAIHEGNGLIRAGTRLDANARLELHKVEVGYLEQISNNTFGLVDALSETWRSLKLSFSGFLADMAKVPLFKSTSGGGGDVDAKAQADADAKAKADADKAAADKAKAEADAKHAETQRKLKADYDARVAQQNKLLDEATERADAKRLEEIKAAEAERVKNQQKIRQIQLDEIERMGGHPDTGKIGTPTYDKVADMAQAGKVGTGALNAMLHAADPYSDIVKIAKQDGMGKAVSTVTRMVTDQITHMPSNIKAAVKDTPMTGAGFDEARRRAMGHPTDIVSANNKVAKSVQVMADAASNAAKTLSNIGGANKAAKLGLTGTKATAVKTVAKTGLRMVPGVGAAVEGAIGVYEIKKSLDEYGKDAAAASAVATTVAVAAASIDPTGITSALIGIGAHAIVGGLKWSGVFGQKNEKMKEEKVSSVSVSNPYNLSPGHPMYKSRATYNPYGLSGSTSGQAEKERFSPGHPMYKKDTVALTINNYSGHPADNPMLASQIKSQQANDKIISNEVNDPAGHRSYYL